MSRRLEVEITSARDDGTFTWRAAGAKEPKGTLDGALLYDGASVGDVVRADAEFGVDGVTIVGVMPPKEKKAKADMLEFIGGAEGGVTTQLVGKRGRGEGRGRDRGEGGGRGGNRGRGRDDKRGGGNRGGDSRGRGDNRGGGNRGDSRGTDNRRDGRGQRPRRDRSDQGRDRRPAAPKPKRLRAQRTHRDALIRSYPEMQQPLARIVLRDGVPGLRKTVQEQNEAARATEQPEIPTKILEAVGERMLPQLRSAEWRDNAEAAIAGIGEVDIRDLRKVVVASENGAKDESSKALAKELADGLTARVEAEHGKWLSELNTLLVEGRTVRALRQSSRPPKAGSPLPADLAARLAAAANESMTADTSSERWATVLDAVAYSPVRQQVAPAALPGTVSDELRATVKKLEKRIPHISAMFAAPEKTARPIPPPTS